jgi:hypothetical protein
MSLEFVNTFGTLGTFIVIAATAIVAIVQLRHMRGSNQITALNELRETLETPDFQAASHFVGTELPAKLRDPAFRYQIVHRLARTDENRPLITRINSVGNVYEAMGLLVKTGFVEKDLVMGIWSTDVTDHWENLVPITAIARRSAGERRAAIGSVAEAVQHFLLATRRDAKDRAIVVCAAALCVP